MAEIAEQIDQDADLEVRILSSYRDYCAAPRERQRALWGKLAVLIGQRSERQIQRMERRMGLA